MSPSLDEIPELFPPGERGESLTDADEAAVAAIAADEARARGEALLRWYRAHPDRYPAFLATVRRMVGERGPGIAPLHVACEMRRPPRGVEPVAIDNAAAVFLARLAARRESDLRRAFDFREAAAADAIFAAGWTP